MAEGVGWATDPLGNQVFLVHAVFPMQEQEMNQEYYDNLAMVVQRPALLVELKAAEQIELYYLRAVSWDHKVLLVVRFTNNRWESVRQVENPSAEELADIIKKGRQLI